MTEIQKKAQKLLRVYPTLNQKEKAKAVAWLRQNGLMPQNQKPSTTISSQVASPNKAQNQLRIPMFLERIGSSGEGAGYYNDTIITDAGVGQPSRNNASTLISIPANKSPVLNQYNSSVSTDSTFGHFTVKSLTFSTRQTPWARMKVLGIETSIQYTPTQPLMPRVADAGNDVAVGVGFAAPPRILLKNYRVAGSANLFLQDGYIDGTLFDVQRYALGGLRSYPILESPKTLKIDVAVTGEHYHGSTDALGAVIQFANNGIQIPNDTNITFSISAIVDVTFDNDYGYGTPGPYASGINNMRSAPKSGQSFIGE